MQLDIIWCFQNFKVCSFELFGDLFNCAIPRLNFMRWCKIKWAYIKLWERNLVSHYMFFILNGHVMNQNKKEVDKVIAHRWENVDPKYDMWKKTTPQTSGVKEESTVLFNTSLVTNFWCRRSFLFWIGIWILCRL